MNTCDNVPMSRACPACGADSSDGRVECPRCLTYLHSQPATVCIKCGSGQQGQSVLSNTVFIICEKCSPKPKFWLWDFRKRKVCNWSFMYGCLFAASASCAGLGLSKNGDAAIVCFAFAWGLLVAAKRIHSKLPLAGKDKE